LHYHLRYAINHNINKGSIFYHRLSSAGEKVGSL
jgi:hypothetical protein